MTPERNRPLRIGMLGLYGMPLPKRHFTGFETGFGEIAPRLVAMGHEVTIYCRRGQYPGEMRPREYKGVRLIYVPSPGGKNFSGILATLFSVVHAVFRERFDVYFFVNVGMGFHCALARAFGKKVVLNVDGLDWTRGKWGPVARNYFLLAAHAAMRVCNRLVTDAEAMRRFYMERFGKETTMIAYGAYVESSTRPELIDAFGLRKDEYYLIASRLIPENNADLIIRGFIAAGTKKKLVIAGGANYDSPFHRSLAELATPAVRFTGHIDDQEVIKELHCNCYAYVHGHSVGGTNPSLLKAMGYGNAILALDTVFNREVLGDTGLFFRKDAQDLAALMRLLEADSQLRADLMSRAPERVAAHYTWDGVSRQYADLFESVVAGSERTA